MAYRTVSKKSNDQRQFKLVLLGESSVGKSSLVLRFGKDLFHEYQESTIGAAFLTQKINLGDEVIKFELWDTAGQERYQSLAPMYYRKAQAAIIAFDITDYSTFKKAKDWVLELKMHAPSDIVIALAGNKLDLSAMRRVETKESQVYAHENGLLFMETSAKTNVNVTEIFKAIAEKLYKDNTKSLPKQDQRLDESEGVNKNIKNCCK